MVWWSGFTVDLLADDFPMKAHPEVCYSYTTAICQLLQYYIYNDTPYFLIVSLFFHNYF